MKKILLSLLAYAGFGVVTLLASITFPNSIASTYSDIGGSGGAPMLSTNMVNEIVPKNNSPSYAPATKAAVGNMSFAKKESILVPQLTETTLMVSDGNIDAKHMILGCKNHGYLYAIA